MAPPLPLANVAGTLALSFTAGRAAPASEPPPVQRPVPPSLPAAPGETDAAPSPSTEPATEASPPTEPATEASPPTEPATPEPTTPEPLPPSVASVASVEPIGPAELENPLDEDTPILAPRLLRPNQRKLMFNLFVGGSRALRGYFSYGGSELKAEASVGGHDRSFRRGGFAVVQVNAGFPFNSFTLAPRLSLNRQILPDYAFYFTTNLTLGYRLSVSSYGYSVGYYGAPDGYGNYSYDSSSRYLMHSGLLGVSWGASAIIAERLLLSFRPLDLELVAPAPSVVQINWSVMGGVGILWGRTNKD